VTSGRLQGGDYLGLVDRSQSLNRFRLHQELISYQKIQPSLTDLMPLGTQSKRLLPYERDTTEAEFHGQCFLVETLKESTPQMPMGL